MGGWMDCRMDREGGEREKSSCKKRTWGRLKLCTLTYYRSLLLHTPNIVCLCACVCVSGWRRGKQALQELEKADLRESMHDGQEPETTECGEPPSSSWSRVAAACVQTNFFALTTDHTWPEKLAWWYQAAVKISCDDKCKAQWRERGIENQSRDDSRTCNCVRGNVWDR